MHTPLLLACGPQETRAFPLTQRMTTASVDMATRDAAAGTAGQEFAIGRTGKCLMDLKNTNCTHSHSDYLVLPS